MATLNYIRDDGVFDEALIQNTLTNPLVKNVNFIDNTKNFTLTDVTVSGYKTHTRDKGFNAGTYSNEKEVYTVTQDRDIEFYIDTMDVDETNQDLSAANISRKFIETQSGPEVDAYRFEKLAAFATANGNSKTETLTKDNVYSAIKRRYFAS